MKFKPSVINICLYLYLLLKPFYLNSSGTLQISDIFIIVAFFFLIIRKKKRKEGNTNILKMLKEYKILMFFIICVILINAIGYLLYSTNDFINSSLYYIFIMIGIYVFIFKVTDFKFLNIVYYISIFNVLEQVAIFILGVGKYYSVGRYMGTFNDPNQFGFFIILMLMYIYIIKGILNKKSKLFVIVFLLGTYMIFQSASTGMILALVTFLMLQLLCNFNKIILHTKRYLKRIVLSVIVVTIVIVCFIMIYNSNDTFHYKVKSTFDDKIVNSSIYIRLTGKFNKIENGTSNILEDRHLEQLVNYPQYMLFGAGQGNYKRFSNESYYGEIHSTLPSILFYYGIIPFMILIYWIYCNLKGLKLKQMSVYFAILVESFTLLNQRQLLLWVLILLGNIYKFENDRAKEEKNEEVI